MSLQQSIYIITRVFHRSLLFGVGIAHALEGDNWHHIPVALFLPGSYVGYQLFVNQANLVGHSQEYHRRAR